MATITANGADQSFVAADLGGDAVTPILTYSEGAVADDVIRMARIRAGSVVADLRAFISAAVAGASIAVGIESATDSDLDEPEEFLTASSVVSDTAFRSDASDVRVLPEDVYLTVTVTGADIPSGTEVKLVPVVSFNGSE